MFSCIYKLGSITADGKRFLVETQTSDQTSALLNVVENWTEEFRKR